MSKSLSEQNPIDVHLQAIYKTLDRIEGKIDGAPTPESIAHLESRVGSLEENRKWFITTIGALLIKMVYDLLSGGQ